MGSAGIRRDGHLIVYSYTSFIAVALQSRETQHAEHSHSMQWYAMRCPVVTADVAFLYMWLRAALL